MIQENIPAGTFPEAASATRAKPIVITRANGSKTIIAGGEVALREIESAFARASARQEVAAWERLTAPLSVDPDDLLIPKILHSVWLGPVMMPLLYERYLQTWRDRHPEWTLMRWNTAILPRMINKEMFEAATDCTFKTDLVKYEVLFQFGGIYVAETAECCRSLECLLGGVEAFAFTDGGGRIDTSIIGAATWHPALADVIGSAGASLRNRLRQSESCRIGTVHFTDVISARHPEVTLFPDSLIPQAKEGRGCLLPRHTTDSISYAVRHADPSALVAKTCTVVIIDSGNAAELRRCLEGLSCQSAVTASWDVVVAGLKDATAPSDSREATNRFIKRLTLQYLCTGTEGERCFASSSLNAAVRAATGEIVIFLGADTVPDFDFVRQHQMAHASEPTAAYGVVHTTSNGNVPTRRRDRIERGDSSGAVSTHTHDSVDQQLWGIVNGSVAKMTVLTLGGFDEDEAEPEQAARDFAERISRFGLKFTRLEQCQVYSSLVDDSMDTQDASRHKYALEPSSNVRSAKSSARPLIANRVRR